MKQLLLLLALSCTTGVLQAQPWDSVTVKDYPVFTRTEVEPQYDGGKAAWKKYLKKNLKKNVGSEAPAGEYTVLVQFIVHEDGTLTDVQANTRHGYGMEEEAVRLVRHTPRWIPARQNKQAVTCYHRQLITFSIH
jgi:protein TonB